MSGIKPPLR
jgi:hypothetical protein